jgi:Asp/Glu/hydantoin racemase
VVILGGAALADLAAQIQPAVPVPVLCSVETGAAAALAAAAAGARDWTRPTLAVKTTGLALALAKLLTKAESATSP